MAGFFFARFKTLLNTSISLLVGSGILRLRDCGWAGDLLALNLISATGTGVTYDGHNIILIDYFLMSVLTF